MAQIMKLPCPRCGHPNRIDAWKIVRRVPNPLCIGGKEEVGRLYRCEGCGREYDALKAVKQAIDAKLGPLPPGTPLVPRGAE